MPRRIEGLSGLIAIGGVATVGFLMSRAFSSRRSRPGGSSDGGVSYWSSGSDFGSSKDSDRSEGSWFSGLFGSSDNSSHDSGGSFDSGSSSSDSGGGGGDGGGGGGD